MVDPRYLAVGTIRKPHGIKGELFVRLETDQPDAVFRPGRTLWIGDAATDRPAGEVLTVERARPFKDGILLKPVGHDGRTEAAEQLRGRSLLIPESEAEPLGVDEIFYHQLIGMSVVAGDETVGTIRDVFEAPAGDLIVIEREGRGELVVPFVRSLVRDIRPEDGVIEIDPPEGLLDL